MDFFDILESSAESLCIKKRQWYCQRKDQWWRAEDKVKKQKASAAIRWIFLLCGGLLFFTEIEFVLSELIWFHAPSPSPFVPGEALTSLFLRKPSISLAC
jgi:hypothetical protein